MNAPFTALDVIVFVIVLLSGILAMLRGFTREVLSILSWVVALGAAAFAYLNADLRGQAHELIQPDWLADAVLVGATFIIVLIVISFITVRLTDFILDSRVGAIDRTLGLLFGVARGLVLVAVAYLFFAWLVPTEQQPQWVRNAQATPYMESSREILLSLLPEDPTDLIEQLPGGLDGLGGGDTGPGSASPAAPEGQEPDQALPEPDPTFDIVPDADPSADVDEREASLPRPGGAARS